MELLAGTSGYCYKPWRGRFYPEKMAERDMLRYYGERLPTVEINNTFYRMPSPTVLEHWAGEVPAHFRFTLKAPRRITHEKRLVDCADHVSALVERSRTLGDKLGALLFQLPPFLKIDVGRLAAFLVLVPAGTPVAVEFRHDSWQHESTYAALAARGAMLCVTDTDEGDTPFFATAPTGYVRLRRTHYEDDELRAWAGRIAAHGAARTYVYFMHEDDALGTKWAATLAAQWRAITTSSSGAAA